MVWLLRVNFRSHATLKLLPRTIGFQQSLLDSWLYYFDFYRSNQREKKRTESFTTEKCPPFTNRSPHRTYFFALTQVEFNETDVFVDTSWKLLHSYQTFQLHAGAPLFVFVFAVVPEIASKQLNNQFISFNTEKSRVCIQKKMWLKFHLHVPRNYQWLPQRHVRKKACIQN